MNWRISQVSSDHSEFATNIKELLLVKLYSENKKCLDAQKNTTKNTERSKEKNQLVRNWGISQVSHANTKFTTIMTELL